MADENPMAHGANDAGDDLQDQALVLDRLFIHWPTQLQPPSRVSPQLRDPSPRRKYQRRGSSRNCWT